MHPYSKQLQDIIDKAITQIKKLDQSHLEFKPTPKKWSKKELIGHLIDSAFNNYQRFIRATYQDNLIFQGYDQDEWVILNDYQNRSLDEILSTWQTLNQHISILIDKLPDELLVKKTQNHNFHKICMNLLPEKSTTSLSYLIWDYLFHVEYHLKQIIENYKELGQTYDTSILLIP